jgi:hypothetical protein
MRSASRVLAVERLQKRKLLRWMPYVRQERVEPTSENLRQVDRRSTRFELRVPAAEQPRRKKLRPNNLLRRRQRKPPRKSLLPKKLRRPLKKELLSNRQKKLLRLRT